MASNNLAKPESAEKLLENFFDENTFTGFNTGNNTSVITGTGYADGTLVSVFAFDVDKNKGGVNSATASSLLRLYKYAVKTGTPVVGFYNTSGGMIEDGASLLLAYSEILTLSSKLSGTVPQIAVIDGVCAGASALIAALSDIVIATECSEIFINSPFVSEDGKAENAGTAKGAAQSGIVHILEKDGISAAKTARNLISILPANNLEVGCCEAYPLNDAEISSSLKGKELVQAIFNKDSTIEFFNDFGSAFTGLAALDWRTVAVISANDRLSRQDSAKIARFAHFADSLSLPIVTIIDIDGFKASSSDELSGGIRDAARLAQVYSSATTQKIALITGNAVSSAYIAMSSADLTIAWDNAVISPISPKAAVAFLYPEKIANESDISKLADEYAKTTASPTNADICDRIIKPNETRTVLSDSLDLIADKREINPPKKHINTVF